MLSDKKFNSNSFLLLLKEGDKVAYETLFRLYYDKLIHVAKNYLVHKEDAEEIVQDVFLKLWSKKEILQVSNIHGYLFTMTKNGCLDKIRGDKVKRRYQEESFQVKSNLQNAFLRDEAASLLIENELQKKILKSVNLLPERCRQVFLKSRIDGLKNSEIAEELGIAQKTVENHMSKALIHMKLHLKEFLTFFI